VTRSDFIWNIPHPDTKLLNENHIYIPDGEKYGGVTDRHTIIPAKYVETYLNIIEDELKYSLKNKLLGCPTNKVDILLVNLVPFIKYPFNLNINWILSLELKYIIKKNIKNKNLIDSNEIKKNIVDELWDKYIKTEIVEEDYLGTIISQWITKIKV
jgi:hypothetical protein